MNKSKDLFIMSSDLSTPVDDILARASKMNEDLYTGYEEVGQDPLDIEEESELNLLNYHHDLFDSVFYRIGGRAKSTTELIFARPGQGKTFYLKMKEGMLANSGHKGINFHLEDTPNEAAKRLKAVADGEKARNVTIVTKHRYLHDILQDIRYYKHKYGIEWFSVDHLGRVRVAGYDARNKLEAQIEVSHRLTDICSELDLFGMLVVQPNKSKDREGWRATLREEDLKGATEVFEDAFVVTTLFRPCVYPELRTNDGRFVKDFDNKPQHYDSVYATQIKNRRARLQGDMLHLVQHNEKLMFMRDYVKINGKEATSKENQPKLPQNGFDTIEEPAF